MPAPEADLPLDYCAERTAMMPKRRRTRAQNRAHRIATERRHNREARKRAERIASLAISVRATPSVTGSRRPSRTVLIL